MKTAACNLHRYQHVVRLLCYALAFLDSLEKTTEGKGLLCANTLSRNTGRSEEKGSEAGEGDCEDKEEIITELTTALYLANCSLSLDISREMLCSCCIFEKASWWKKEDN